MKKILFIIVILIIAISAGAQIPVGQFKAHLPFHGFHSVTKASDCIYAANTSGILYIDKSSQEINTWSKVEGLSEEGIDVIGYAPDEEVLIVAYSTSNLDFIHNGKVTNITDIKNKQMSGSKRINSIYVHNGVAYLAAAFGVVKIDLQRFLILDTWLTHTNGMDYNVKAIELFDDKFYVTTDKGVFYISQNSQLASDFTQWHKVSELPEGEYSFIKKFDGRLYVCQHINNNVDSIFEYRNEHWEPAPFGISAVRDIQTNDKEIMICYWSYIQSYDQNEETTFFGQWLDVEDYADAQQAVVDGDNIWIADNNNGLGLIHRKWGTHLLFSADGPHSEMVYKLDATNDRVAVVSGSNLNWSSKYLPVNLSYYYQYDWNNIWCSTYPDLNTCYDLIEVAINPRNPKEIYAGSWGFGLFRYENGEYKGRFDFSNSNLRANENNRTFVSGIDYDNYNNMWMTNSFSEYPLHVLKSDGKWASFDLRPYVTGKSTVVDQVLVDSRNYKWLTMPRENKIVVFSDNGTIDNRSDDHIATVNLNSYCNIQTTMVNCIAEDLEGEIWIGTDQGIKVIYNPYNTFNGGAFAQNILLEQDGYVQNLLQFENVTCIAVDGANRKWIGTSKAGVFLMSDNGTEELLNFSESNSPLFSNQIFDIAIDHTSGEVFFATAKGLISYRGTATAGKDTYEEVKVFPNPVRENYSGTIAVSGLMTNSFCKVVDSAGKLVWQDYANGGELVWDGKDFSGRKVATGVYFVFSSDETGKERNVAKILFIK